MNKTTAIIVAAGSSQRMGFDKLAAPLAGMPVLRRTLEAFLAADCVAEIIVVCSAERWQLLEDAGADRCTKPLRRVDGGATRQESVANGLAAVAAGAAWVAVHDGARPLVSPEDITRCVAAAGEFGAASLARRVTETLKRSDAADFCAEAVARDQLWFMETPQVFELGLLREAYAALSSRQLLVTDEVSAVQTIGKRVKFIEASHPNPKITRPTDLALATAILTIK
ncbi:MAG: 2-C-methyl-D-erythritol 4-phosphate cytidylyltransferase [Verrucomicrobia bacterium]|nr:MAG: 2-C-methyl-D-erythritol 4-phosphate cytidylyltransferase [Verrucomicrobiota bacterium]